MVRVDKRIQSIYLNSSSFRMYNPIAMVVMKSIVITMNIRLGPAGFTGTDAPCNVVNAGVLSCTRALAASLWVTTAVYVVYFCSISFCKLSNRLLYVDIVIFK